MDEKTQTHETTGDTQSKIKTKKKKNKQITVKANKKGKHIIPMFTFLRVFALPVYYLLKPFKFYGNRKVKDGACVYVQNHYTLLDVAYPIATTWEGLHFVAKKETFSTFGFAFLARRTKAIAANRDGSDVRTLLDCLKCLKNGEKIVIYPEGTRNKTGEEMLPFKHGAAMMAIRAKVPVIALVAYEKPRYFRCTHYLISEPIELTEYYDKKMTEEDYVAADEKLRDIMLQMRREHKEYLENKKRKGKKHS